MNMPKLSEIEFNEEEVLLENGDIIEVRNEKVVNEELSDLELIADDFLFSWIEDINILEEAMKIHREKRYNRKYINSRKYLVKDKRNLFQKAYPVYPTQTDNKLILDRVLDIDNLCILNQELVRKESEYRIQYIDIEYNKKFVFGSLVPEQYQGYAIIVNNKFDNFTFIKYNSSEFKELTYDYISENLISINDRELIDYLSIDNHRIKGVAKVNRIIQYSNKNILNKYNMKVHFYGKRVIGNFFVENTKLPVYKLFCHYEGFNITIQNEKEDIRKEIEEGIESYEQERRDYEYFLYECDYEEDDYYFDPYEGFPVKEFLGMNVFYYEDHGNYDLIEKKEEEIVYDDCDYYYGDEDFFSDMCEDYWN